MSERRSISQQAAEFRRHYQTTVQQPRPEQTMTDAEKRELAEKSSQLLNLLATTARRFVHVEELDLDRKPGFSSLSLTPSVKLTSEAEEGYGIFLDEYRFARIGGTSQTGADEIDPNEVKATLFMTIPEAQEPVPLIRLEGRETRDGSLQCAKINTNSDFFQTPEERAGIAPADQLSVVDQSIEIASALADILQGVDFGPVVDGQRGHVLVTRDQRHGEQTLFISHRQTP